MARTFLRSWKFVLDTKAVINHSARSKGWAGLVGGKQMGQKGCLFNIL